VVGFNQASVPTGQLSARFTEKINALSTLILKSTLSIGNDEYQHSDKDPKTAGEIKWLMN
jgi:hypothetical protein